MDLTTVATIMNTVVELLGQHWIALAVLGHAARIEVAQPNLLPILLIFSKDLLEIKFSLRR